MQRIHCHRNHPQGLARLAKFPAGDGDHALRLKVIKIFAKGFHGVQIVFTEGEGSRSGGSPGVDQSHLYDVKTLRSRTKKRAAVGDVDVYFGTLVKVLRVVGIAFAHDSRGDNGVNFNTRHDGSDVRHGAEEVNSADG